MFIDADGQSVEAKRVFCIGCNYAEHVRELHGFEEIPPVIFMKPAESLLRPDSATCGILSCGNCEANPALMRSDTLLVLNFICYLFCLQGHLRAHVCNHK